MLLTLLVLLWAGMLLAIPFLEAWVKFRAPSLSLAEGLDVGRQVFGALNVVEVVAAASVVTLAWMGRAARRIVRAVAVAAAIVAVQSVWLLPVLDARVGLILAGEEPADAPYHVLYIGLEVIKLMAVLFAGIASLRSADFAAGAPARGAGEGGSRNALRDSVARSISRAR